MALRTSKLFVTAESISFVRLVSEKNCFLGVKPMLDDAESVPNFAGTFKAAGILAGLNILHPAKDINKNRQAILKTNKRGNLKIAIFIKRVKGLLMVFLLF